MPRSPSAAMAAAARAVGPVTPRRRSSIGEGEWGMDDIELLQTVAVGNDFLQEAVERAQKVQTRSSDSLPPTPGTPHSVFAEDKHGVLITDRRSPGAQLTWTVTLPAGPEPLGFKWKVQENRDSPKDSKVTISEVSSSGNLVQVMNVGDEIIDISKMRPLEGLTLFDESPRQSIVLRLTTKFSEHRLGALIPKPRILATRPTMKSVGHDVIILRLPTENDKEGDAIENNIEYQYSTAPWMKHSEQLLRHVIGGLITLYAQLNEELTRDHAKSSLLHTNDGQILQVVYHTFGSDHIILFASNANDIRLSEFEFAVNRAMFCFQAFHGPLSKSALRLAGPMRLDGFFRAFFSSLPLVVVDPTVLSSFGSPPRLFCSESLRLEISDVLDGLETKCVSTDDCRPDQSLAIASCLFHRGSLVWSHFSPSDMSVITAVCNHYCMLTAEPKRAPCTVVFRIRGTSAETQDSEAYLLITMLEKATMCLLLKCWSTRQLPKSVDISQILDVELRLRMLYVNGTLSRINECSITSTQKQQRSNNNGSATFQRAQSVSPDLALYTKPSKRAIKRDGSVPQNYSGQALSGPAKKPQIFHSLHVDGLSGIAVVGADSKSGAVIPHVVAKGILRNFYRTAQRVRTLLYHTPTTPTERFKQSVDSIGDVSEIGLMFCFDSHGGSPVTYWVVGRRFGPVTIANPHDLECDPKEIYEEFYVCFLEGTHPSIVELAFELKGKLLS